MEGGRGEGRERRWREGEVKGGRGDGGGGRRRKCMSD